ncbi:pyridoxamine 5'-phosphate oxidase family protein [Sanguibacter antarcticus]|uniref:Pyridoxamine 5'-phosphate oxidase n=1 Tax=Sanguibacter antarcticus TaxID=372484 RepID=A0A2A9E3N4_9MICO|nr:pyridoxamine 5'-phosphate oxidase family protein [Sanguibacter antarcticus]PFG32965.1 pyridoxamine 5'-phosphate oxidase [Sanguibacter antarcticus]
MGTVVDSIDADLSLWIGQQHMFFVATAPSSVDGHVNASPRGLDSFSVLGPTRVGWVDLTGSGVETIAHLRDNGRVCIMFCSFDARPRIVRLHGRGRVAEPGTTEFDEVAVLHPAHTGTRAIVVVDVTRVSDSCGWGVPVMDHVRERDVIEPWSVKKGTDGLVAYREQKNARSIDGLPGLPETVAG